MAKSHNFETPKVNLEQLTWDRSLVLKWYKKLYDTCILATIYILFLTNYNVRRYHRVFHSPKKALQTSFFRWVYMYSLIVRRICE